MFVIVTLLAFTCGYLTWKANILLEQNQIILDLQRLGASVTFEHTLNVPPPVPTPGPEFLKRLLGEYAFSQVDQIRLSGEDVTDETLIRVAMVSRPASLILSSDRITDRGLAHLAELRELRALEVQSRNTTAAGYKQLRGMKLSSLILRRNNRTSGDVDDSWMPEIAALTQVRYLSLQGTQITDAGLAHLHHSKELRRLFLADTKVTAKGVEAFKSACPQCVVKWP